jgi:hypothetical protein
VESKIKAVFIFVIFLRYSTLNLYAEAHQKMMQRPIVAYLSLKEMSAREIHDDVVAILGPDALDGADQLLATVEGVLEALKSDLASGLARLGGLIKEMYRYQWGGY